MQARLLTEEQKDLLVDQPYNLSDTRFWVKMNEDDQWCLTEDMVQACEFPYFDWLKECPLIEFVPKQYNLPF
jgi:hypothetical protein